MPTPSITSIELTSGSEVVLTSDPMSPAANEFALYGSNLEYATSVELDSGDDYSWVVGSMSASANTLLLTAYAYGPNSGSGTVVAKVFTSDSDGTSPILEIEFVLLPLLD